MQAIGGQVIIVIAIPFVTLVSLAIYYRKNVWEFLVSLTGDSVRNQQNEQQGERRRNRIDDRTCSICWSEPKQYQVSSTCSHSFCGECILSLYQHNGLQIKCPLCRQNITLLFKLFQSDENSVNVQTGITYYNSLFDDSSRSVPRRVVQFPYTLKRLWRTFFSWAFLLFFFRTLMITRWLFIIIIYLLIPIDLIPQRMFGVVGFIDDFLFALLILVFLLTLAAMQYHRRQNN